ncbi:unnamed protein product [Rodentolepis nana]|uniref:Protein kinase domain-containing protein n=1 Tax=Rodentolepis nana TaxID=102285 RepID=A0A0R3TYD6_RODNA|nr:unnamed protein product [Rodentolepis nana]
MNCQLFPDEVEYIKDKIIENEHRLSSYVIDLPISQNCHYTLESKLGEGSYGVVFSAKQPYSTDTFVVKRFKEISESIMLSTIRELCFLNRLRHDNIVRLIEICCEIDGDFKIHFGLVLEACVCNLEVFTEGDVITHFSHKKSIIQQIFRGLSFMHGLSVLHRDLKPGNILINPNGIIKIADFGLAQVYRSIYQHLSPNIITPGYKPPETICMETIYDAKVDIFSIGVVIVELFTAEPLFPEETTREIVIKMTRLLGKFKVRALHWGANRRHYNRYFSNLADEPPTLVPYLEERGVPEEAINLIVGLLQLNPANRPTAAEVLENSFFTSDPTPDGNFLQLIPSHKRLISEDQDEDQDEDEDEDQNEDQDD